MTVLASHQPDFFPYMGYFYKIFKSDIFVFSDNVQYSKSGRHNYNEILTGNGVMRITLPVHYKCDDICNIQLAADRQWADRIIKTLTQEYKKAPHFDEAFPVIKTAIERFDTFSSLASFNIACLLDLAERFGLDSRAFVRSSTLDLNGRKDERILDMCFKTKTDVYYSGTAAMDYHNISDYENNGIRLVCSDYQPVRYKQVYGDFTPNLSCIDYVMNCGFVIPKEWSRDVR